MVDDVRIFFFPNSMACVDDLMAIARPLSQLAAIAVTTARRLYVVTTSMAMPGRPGRPGNQSMRMRRELEDGRQKLKGDAKESLSRTWLPRKKLWDIPWKQDATGSPLFLYTHTYIHSSINPLHHSLSLPIQLAQYSCENRKRERSPKQSMQ